jgi:DNA-binding beta-propeller fold protein YncE
MNNAHNMWTDKDQHLIHTTQWFDNKTSIFDRNTGKLVKNIEVGNDPSHVMTSTKTDELMVVLHGEQGVTVFGPKGESIESYTYAVSWTRPVSSTRTLVECR